MGYYYNDLSTAYSNTPTAPNYLPGNAIIVDLVNGLLASSTPTTTISHTAGTTSSGERWVIQIGNSDHYAVFYNTVESIANFDDSTYIDASISDFTGISYIATAQGRFSSYSVSPPAASAPVYQLFSPNVYGYAIGNSNGTVSLAWFKGQTGDWYAMQWAGGTLTVYRNGDNTGMSTNEFLMPLQSTSYFLLTPYSIYQNNEVLDFAVGVIGSYNANNTYLPSPSIHQSGSNYYMWYNGFACSDQI